MKYVEGVTVQQYVGHEAIVNPTEVDGYDIAVSLDSDVLGGEQMVHLGVAEGSRDPKGVLIVPVSWSDSDFREFHANRLGSMAKFTGLRVIGIDYPGMGNLDGGRGDELSEKQIEEAKAGRMENLTQVYWTALQGEQLLLGADQQKLPIAFWGHSLASFTVAEMAASAPEGHEITDIHFSEIMALKKSITVPFALKFALKGMYDLGLYTDLNTGMPDHESGGLGDLAKQTIAQRQSHFRSFQTLTRGRHQEVVRLGFERGRLSEAKDSGTKLTIVSGEKGLVPAKALSRFIQYVRDPLSGGQGNNFNLEAELLSDTGHGYQDALPAVLDQSTKLAIIQTLSGR